MSVDKYPSIFSRKTEAIVYFRRSNFYKDSRDKAEVPDPLVVEDLISDKLNNFRLLFIYCTDLGQASEHLTSKLEPAATQKALKPIHQTSTAGSLRSRTHPSQLSV